jgi:hypothetical protein
MQAAMKLADILLEHDRAEARRGLAELKAAGRQSEPSEPIPTPEETETPDAKRERLLAKYRKGSNEQQQ